MAWDSQYALDGFFQFGSPLNVTEYVIDPDDNKFGKSTDTYRVARFLLDEEIAAIGRLHALVNGPIVHYPVVYLLRQSSATVGAKWVMEQKFYKSWLFSLGGNFVDPRRPGWSIGGQTLEIGFDRADKRPRGSAAR
jgi:hypothetical protein